MFLTTKSILDCNDAEKEIHYMELLQIKLAMKQMPNYDIIMIINNERSLFRFYSLLDMMIYPVSDSKHFRDIDVLVGDNDILTLIEYKGKQEKKRIMVLPLDSNNEFIDIIKQYEFIKHKNVKGIN